MKCPNSECSYNLELEEFGEPFQDIEVECPKCHSKVKAEWDYQITGDLDEYPYVSELILVDDCST